jgi:hypothetical protein
VYLCVEQTFAWWRYEIDNKYSILNKMPVDEFDTTNEKVVKHSQRN